MCLYVIYGFDTASTLAEETRNPRAEAPKAVLGSVIGAFVIGAIFLWGVLIAVPDMGDAVAGFFATGRSRSSRASCRRSVTTLYLLVVVGGDLRVLHVDPDLDDPPGVRHGARRSAAVLEGDVEGQPTAAHADLGLRRSSGRCRRSRSSSSRARQSIAVGATASIYLSYLLGNLAVMRARMQGWPKTKAPFSLGKWGKVVNVVAILWGVAMLAELPDALVGYERVGSERVGRELPADLLATRSRSRPTTTSRAISSSTSRSTFLNKIPVIWTVFAVVFIVGALYYFARAEEEAVGAGDAAR